MPSKLPPGLPFFIRRLGVNVFPAVLVFVAARALHTLGLVDAPLALGWVALVAALSVPAVYAGRIVYRDWSVKRRAARMGAVLPPSWEGKAFGNTDILKYAIEAFHRGYPGTCQILFNCWYRGRSGGRDAVIVSHCMGH